MFRPLNHKPPDEVNDYIGDDDDDDDDDDETERGEWKIQLVMQKRYISTKNFAETRTIYSASEAEEIFMCSDTEDVFNTLFNTILHRFYKYKKHQMIMKANLFLTVLNYYIIIFKK